MRVGSSPGITARASAGAESPLALRYVTRKRKEPLTALIAEPFNSARARALRPRDPKLVRADEPCVSGAPAMPVAGMARRDKVHGVVVLNVPVEVVGDQGSLLQASSGHPFDVSLAPMAAMWARADLVVQGKTRRCNHARGRSKWMPTGKAHPLKLRRLFAEVRTTEGVVARPAAKSARSLRFRCEREPALLADMCSCHNHNGITRRPRWRSTY